MRQDELIGEEDERLGGFGILEPDAAQMIGVMPVAVVAIEGDGLVADDPGAAIDRSRIEAMGVEIRLGAGYKEGASLMQDVQSREIQIPAIHHVNRTGFRDQHVQDIDVVQLSIGDVNEARDRTAQIEQRMHLHGGLGRAEERPREDRQAEVDCRRIERVDGFREFHPKDDKSPIASKGLKYGAEHTRFVPQMMKSKLTGDKIKALGLKGQHRAIRLDPGDISQFGPCLAQHTERSVETHQPGLGHDRVIGHELASRPAGNIQDRRMI